jgi:hypothetical protein
VTQQKTFVEAEGPVRTWARSKTTLTNVVGASGIFFGAPKGRALPHITFSQFDGAPLPGEAPLEEVFLSFSVWGSTKKQASDLAAILRGEVESIGAGTLLDATLRCGGARVLRALWQPDVSVDPPVARYIVETAFTVRKV